MTGKEVFSFLRLKEALLVRSQDYSAASKNATDDKDKFLNEGKAAGYADAQGALSTLLTDLNS